MKLTHKQKIALLVVALLLLVAIGIFGSWLAPLPGEAGQHLHRVLLQRLFNIGTQPVTLLFLVKSAIFLVVLLLLTHFAMLFLQKRILIYTALQAGQQYALARVISYLLFVLGLTVGLESVGLNLSSLLVLGGARGIGVGFGLQAIVGNFVAGLILLLEQPIKLGDRIEVGSTYGDVMRMGGRSTWVRTNDNVVIIVPNSEFISNRVTNWTANDRTVRISLPVGVSYDSDPASVRELLIKLAQTHPDVLSEPAPEVIFAGFGDSSLDFELRMWTIQQVQTPSKLKSDLYFSIFAAFRSAGIEIPFPQRDLHLRSISGPLPAGLMAKGVEG